MTDVLPPMIEVGTGRFVDLIEPDPATLTLRDIARGLAYTCRYGGHVSRFYSVAEHAVLVRDLLRSRGAGPDTQRAALFHDAAEAYLGDVVAPLKWALRRVERDGEGGRSAYDELTDRMDRAIAQAFKLDGLSYVPADIRLADMWALRIEASALTHTGGTHWRWPTELPNGGNLPPRVRWDGGLAPDDALLLWLDAAETSATSVTGALIA